GTHNRLLSIAGPTFERAYLEIIAIDPDVAPPGHARWFGLDDPDLQQALRQGPRLVHFVARVPDLAAACAAWSALDLQPGTAVAASRDTPRGRLEWQITVRKDGRPQHEGALPTLIQWGTEHPAQSLPDSGVSLRAFSVSAPRREPLPGHPSGSALRDSPLGRPGGLMRAFACIGLAHVPVTQGPPGLHATLHGPRGAIALQGGFGPWNA
ncbi:MAG TPA: VOC family protein, partial [Burkholderiaceae bacterium]|nr:VOC family protein [Burkholderiaceae bacterium]